MRRLIPLLVVAFAAAACASAETGDAEVELNTALGRRGTPSSTTMPPIPTNTPSTTPATQAPVLTSGPQTTTSAAPTTTEVPCAALETAAVVASGDFWRLEGRADDGTPVRSPDYPLAEALGQLTSERDFDLDGHPEYVVTLMAPDVARLMVLEFRDCSLVEPRDAFSGEPLRPLVGAYPDTLGRVTCLADGLEIAALRATFDPPATLAPDTSAPDTSAPTPSLSGWAGTVDEVSLFAGSWEVRSSTELALGPDAAAEWTPLDC